MNNYKKEGLAEDREPKQKVTVEIVDLCPSTVSKERQRFAVLEALKSGPVSSVQLREKLGVLHPSGRIMELRKQGLEIETQQTTAIDADGRPHKCALFVLKNGDAA